MSNEIKCSEASDSSAKRFRKPLGIEKKATQATFDEFWKAIDTGIKGATQKDLSPRKMKDKTNVVTNWIEKNQDIANLDTEEQKEFNNLRKSVHDTFEDYKWAHRMLKRDLSTEEQAVRDATQQYLKWAQSIEERVIQYKTNKIDEIDNKIDKNYESIKEERKTVMKSIHDLSRSNPEQLMSEIRHNIKNLRKETKKVIENLITICSEEDIKKSVDEIKDHIKTYIVRETEYEESSSIPKKLSKKVDEIDKYYETYGKLLEKLIQEREGYFSLKSDLENRARSLSVF